MDYINGALLGLLQGLTEFLPVSSSGHLVLAQRFFGLTPSLLLTVVLHMGSLVAVASYYFKDLWAMARRPLSKPTLQLVLATIPAVAAALLLDDLLDSLFSGRLLWVGFLLTSVVLTAGEILRRRGEGRANIGTKDAAVMGLGQALAIMPGLSRSGTTITAGQLAGLDREASAKFSFLMAVPVILGSFALEGAKAVKAGVFDVPAGMLIVGFIASAAASAAAIRGLLYLIKRRSLFGFALWTLLMAVVSFFWL